MGDCFGAFADTAVLFPLLAALSIRSDFSGTVLLASAGLAYVAAGFFFQIPMSVQPLKSVAIAAIAAGASSLEVRLAGVALGIVCLGISILDPNRWMQWIPKPLVHGIQASLGVLLLLQGLAFTNGVYAPALILFVMVILSDIYSVPVMGFLATIGVVLAVRPYFHWVGISPPVYLRMFASAGIRFGLVASLVLPQIPLTLSNSVVGTADAAGRYFGRAASRVSVKNLMRSIGFGNLAFGAIGGLPFCHGAGGLTAHVRGGARTWRMNLVIGFFLLGLAVWQYFKGGMNIPYPPVLLAALLAATGVFHLRLACPTWNLGGAERLRLILMGAATLATHNLLWALIAGLLPEVKWIVELLGLSFLRRRESRESMVFNVEKSFKVLDPRLRGGDVSAHHAAEPAEVG